MVTLAALAGAVLQKDSANGLLAVSLWITASNDAYTSPHKGRFDPQSVRRIFSRGVSTSDDSALILANGRCLCEAVDTGRGRHYFTLKAPGVATMQLTDVLRNAGPQEFERLLAGDGPGAARRDYAIGRTAGPGGPAVVTGLLAWPPGPLQ